MKQEDATSFVTVGNTGSYQPQLQQPTKSQGGQTVSNHIADANKMVSDTPRTDAEYERLFEIYQNAERINGPLCCAFENDMRLCRQLERELNAANDRIKRLEEVGDEVVINYVNSLSAFEMWRKAKEAKL